ncbi:MAG: tail tape protein [Caudoviricetes sp.]|nr:MAG: tail tape protein [Caudoviricetes sp.]
MSKVASAANLMGVDVDQLNAQLSTIISVTREAPESVGNALKSIYTRMSDIKNGEDDEIELDTYAKKLADLGVYVLDTNKELRGMGEVVEEIGMKWQTMSRESQVALAQTIGGTYQYSRVLALFDNFDKYTEALNMSRTAVGALQEQQDIYLEGTQAHLAKLTAASEDLYDSMFDPSTVNLFTDALTGTVKLATRLVDSLGGGKGALLALGSVGARVFSQQISRGIATSIANLNKMKENAKQVEAILDIKNLFKDAEINDEVLDKLVEMREQVIKYGDIVDETQNEQANQIIRTTNELYNEKEAWEENLQQVNRYIEAISGLDNVDIAGIKREDIDSIDYSSIIQDSIDSIKEVSESMGEYEKKVNKVTAAQKKLKEAENEVSDIESRRDRASDYFDSLIEGTKEQEDALERLIEIESELTQAEKTLGKRQEDSIDAFENLTAEVEGYIDKLQELKEAENVVLTSDQLERINQATENYRTATDSEEEADIRQPSQELINTYRSVMNELESDTARMADILDREAGGALDNINESIDSTAENWKNLISTLDTQALVENLTNLAGSMGQIATSIFSIYDAVKAINDEDLSAGDKVLQVSTDLAIALPFLITGIKGARTSIIGLAESMGLAEAATLDFGASFKTVILQGASSIAGLLSSFAPLIIAIAAVGGGLYLVYRRLTETSRAAEEAAESAKKLTDQYNKLKESYETFRQQAKDYREIVNSLKDLEKGTLQYRDAIDQANEKAMELIESNQELQKYAYRDAKGLIKFRDGKLNEVQQNQRDQLDSADVRRMAASIEASQKQYKADTEKIVNSIGQWVDESGNSIYDFLHEELGVELKDYLENTDQYVAQYRGITGKSAQYATIEDKDIEKLVQAYRENGGLSITDIDDMQGISDELKASIKENYEEGIKPLIQSNIDLKESTKFFATEISRSYLSKENETYQGYGPQRKNAMAMFSSDYEDSDEYKKALEDAKEQVKGLSTLFSDEDLHRKYAELFNVEYISDKFGKGRFATDKADAETYFDLDDEDIRNAVIEELARAAVFATDSTFTEAKADMIAQLDKFSASLNEQTGVKGLRKDIYELASGTDATIEVGMTEEQKQLLLESIKNTSEEALSSIDWSQTEFKNSDMFLETLQAAVENVDTTTLQEKLRDTFMSMEDATKNLMEKVQTRDVSYEDIQDDEDYQYMLKNLETLRETYPEVEAAAQVLSKTWEVGTQKYAEALEIVEDKLFEINQSTLHEELTASIEEVDEELDNLLDKDGNIKVDADTTDFENALSALLDKDYEVTMHVYAEGVQEFESVNRAFDDIYEKANMIGESFIVAASDIRELNNTFPGIIEGMTALGDGTVQLNKEIAQSAIDAAEVEVKADAEAAIDKLETQAVLLRQKQNIYAKMAEAARILANSEKSSEAESTKARETLALGLEDLKTLASQETAQSLSNNDVEVANSSNENAEVVFNNWNESYTQSARSSADWARTVINNMKAVRAESEQEGSGEGLISDGNFSANYTGATGKSQEASIIKRTQQAIDNNERSTAAWGEMAGDLQNIADSYGEAANDLEGAIAQLGARGHELGNAFNNVREGYGTKNPTIETPKVSTPKEEKVKEETVKDPEVLDYLEEERDRYREINIEIEKKNRNLSRLEKIEEGLYGGRLLKNLDKQLKNLENQNDAYREKLALARQEKKEIKSDLKSSGVKFDSSGQIANYQSAMQTQLNYVNSVIDKYNHMTAEQQESYKSVVDKVKENYENFKKNIEKYDNLVNSVIPDLKDDIQENLNKEIEISIKKFNMEIELRLNMGEAWRDYLDFKEKVIREVDEDDILGTTQTDYAQYRSYLKRRDSNEIQSLTQKIWSDIDEIHKINREGWSGIFGDQKSVAMDTLKEDTENLMKDLMEMKELEQQIRESYPKMIDEMSEAFDKQIENYEYIDDLINHDMQLIGLLYGDRAYGEMEQYYNKIEQNNNQQIDFLRQRAEYAKKMFDVETDPDAKEKWEAEWKNSLADLNSTVEKAIQDLQNKYANSINHVMDAWEKGLTGGQTMSDFSDSWDLINKDADYYLDKINSIYEVQKLQNKYMDAIDNADGLQNQKDLNKLMEQQIGMLKDKENLTQYDIDRANKVFEIAQKEAAFREAQNNKTKMRLRRDSQGNYKYEYVADEDNLKAKAQELADLYNSLYNFDKSAVQKNYDDVINIVNEYAEKVRNIKLDMSLTEEERQIKLEELNRVYEEMITKRVTENEIQRLNLKQSAFADMQHEYTMDAELFNEMTNHEYESFKTLTDGSKGFFLEMVNKNVEELERLKDEQDRIVDQGMVPMWENGVQSMIEKFAGPGGFGEEVDTVMSKLREVTFEYEESLRTLEDTAGISFESIKEGHDMNIDAVQELLAKNDELIAQYDQQIQAIQSLIDKLDDLIAKYQDVIDAAKAAVTASMGFQQSTMETAANKAANNVSQVSKDSGSTKTSSTTSTAGPNTKKEVAAVIKNGQTIQQNVSNKELKEIDPNAGAMVSGTITYDKWIGNGVLEKGDKVTVKKGAILYNSLKGGKVGKKAGELKNNVSNKYIVAEVHSAPVDKGADILLYNDKSKEYRWVNRKYLSGYDTGGYTGDWGSKEGKLALLHEKELVLNKEDTKNVLQAINIIRDMEGLFNNINSSLADRIGGLMSGLTSSFVLPQPTSNIVEQEVHIQADFPNVTDSKEIENALNNLVNVASQRAFNTQR